MKHLSRAYHALRLFAIFLYDLVVSSLQVARAVLSPREIAAPRFVTIPLRVTSAGEITAVANFISLTPGTLSIDVSPDRKTLLIHDMFAGESGEATRGAVRDGIEARVLKASRP